MVGIVGAAAQGPIATRHHRQTRIIHFSLLQYFDLRGTVDRAGAELLSTQVAVADELAAAANLVRAGKADGIPVVIVRGAPTHAVADAAGTATEIVMPSERDLFR